MLHPRLTSLDGSQTAWLAQIGTYGAWSDLNVTTRWGSGACGMYEASWSMPLPPDYDHPLLRRGTIVDLMDGPWKVGSSLILTEPGRGGGFDDPWKLVATGVGREVEGENSYYAIDPFSGYGTAVPSTAVDRAIADGLPWAGRDSTVETSAVPIPSNLVTLGALLNAQGDLREKRWGVGQDNVVGFHSDPTTPTYHVVPGVASLGVSDDDYATTVYVLYPDSSFHAPLMVHSTPTAESAAAEARYGHREYVAEFNDGPEFSDTLATMIANGILKKARGRLNWTNGLTVTSDEILTSGGVPADLSKVLEDVGNGCMVRIHGTFDDLIETTGNTWLDIVIGEAKYADGDTSISLSPMGLAPRDLAHIFLATA